jgi:hypothetical protein
VATCFEFFKINQQSPDDENSEYDTQSIKQWPDNFHLENVPELTEYQLKERPHITRQESVSTFLLKTDIRETAKQEMANPDSQFLMRDDHESQSMSVALSQSGVSQQTI